MSKLEPPLPVKNGVSPTRLWLPTGGWKTMCDFLVEKFPHVEVGQFHARFRRREIRLANGQFLTVDSPYYSGTHLFFYRELENEIPIPFKERVIYQDENILVADKPHFLPVAPSGNYLHETLLVRLRRSLDLPELELCHRLDRETAGVILLTKRQSVSAYYNKLFSKRMIKKCYHAIAPASDILFPVVHRSRLVPGTPFFRMREVDGLVNSETHINLIESRGTNCLYRLVPVTGKKHQLRVHLAGLQIPIKNDRFYPKLMMEKNATNNYVSPLQLLAKSLSFVDPFSKNTCYFESQFSL